MRAIAVLLFVFVAVTMWSETEAKKSLKILGALGLIGGAAGAGAIGGLLLSHHKPHYHHAPVKHVKHIHVHPVYHHKEIYPVHHGWDYSHGGWDAGWDLGSHGWW